MGQGLPGFPQTPPESAETFADRMLGFDKDRDGKLSRAEVTDTRLHRLFARADADKDGTVTRKELLDLAAKEAAGDRGSSPDSGPGPGPGGPTTMPRPGEVVPAPLRQRLRLTAEQAKQLDELQKEVDSRLAKILTEEQAKTLRQMRMGPGGPGGRGGPGGPPPGGPPPE
ncbi:EF-hand domain-containing protein [Aquisphaera insulae]|uniref:EF-hand domain-containing protein n=1 Tax=Aquisphaera insulae TaxID=2712864 RepID=UPI00202E5E8E|nr:EF-hand domain-containing protein [Aquisphaera insulae]